MTPIEVLRFARDNDLKSAVPTKIKFRGLEVYEGLRSLNPNQRDTDGYPAFILFDERRRVASFASVEDAMKILGLPN